MHRDNLLVPQTVGVLGCGRVGTQIVDHIASTGLSVCAFDIKPERQAYLKSLAAAPCRSTPITWAMSSEELLEQSRLLMVATGQDCQLRWEHARHMHAGTVVASITSNNSTFPQFFSEALQAADAAATDRTATLVVDGSNGPIHFLALGNAVNLTCGPSLDPFSTLNLHAHVIDVVKTITRDLLCSHDLPRHEILSSVRIADLVSREVGGRRTKAFDWPTFWPVKAEIPSSGQSGSPGVLEAWLCPPTRGHDFTRVLESSRFDDAFFEPIESTSDWVKVPGHWPTDVLAQPFSCTKDGTRYAMAY